MTSGSGSGHPRWQWTPAGTHEHSLSCSARRDLHHCEGRLHSIVESHRFSELYHIKSAAQHTTERDAVLVCTATNRRHSAPPRESRFSSLYRNKLVVQSGHKRHIKRKTSIQLQERNRERKKSLPPLQHTHHKHTSTAHAPAHKKSFCMPSAPAKCGRFARPLEAGSGA